MIETSRITKIRSVSASLWIAPVLSALDTVATKVGTTPAQVALAWLIARPSITAAIASATSLAQLDEIISAARLKLDADAIRRLNEASA